MWSHLLFGKRILRGFKKDGIHPFAYPCVSGRVHYLRVRKHLGLPVGELLRLRNLHTQSDGSHLLDALVLYAPFPDNLLKVHESSSLEIRILLESSDVIRYRRTDLEDIRIRKKGTQFRSHSDILYPEKEGPLTGRKLEKGNPVRMLVGTESRP